MPRIPMDQKELREGMRVRIPENIIAKMSQGLVLSERQKDIVRRHGKVYVEAHKKNGKWIKPFLRDLPSRESKWIPGGFRERKISSSYISTEDKKSGVKRIIDEYDELERLKIDPEARTTDKNVAVGEIEGMKVMLQTFGIIESITRTGRKELEDLYNQLEREGE